MAALSRAAAVASARRFLPELPVALALAGLFVWWNRVLLSHFYGFLYAITDLGIINDWFTNAWYAGRPFWISELESDHLQVHFTPTVLLVAPVYLFTESQYVLPFLGTLAMAAALWLGHRLWLGMAGEVIGSQWTACLWSTFFVLAFGFNIYVREVLDSAHIEIFAIPFAMAFLHLRLRSDRWRLPALLLALALGVREEAGVFLGCQCLMLLTLPGCRRRSRRWQLQTLGFAAACFVYVLLVVKVVNPMILGVTEYHVQRGWSHWGDSWLAVAWAMATSPLRVLALLRDSAFLPLNFSFGLLPWLNPVAAVLGNLPAVLLFGGSAPYQKYLWYYNASFVLPGMFVATYAGGALLARLLGPQRQGRPAARKVWGALFAAAALLALAVLYRQRDICPESTFAYLPAFEGRADAEVVRRWSRSCGPVPRVATDARRIIYAPLRSERFMLRHVERADLAFLFRGADTGWSGTDDPEAIWRLLEGDASFVLREETERYRVYVRRGGRCDAGVPPAPR